MACLTQGPADVISSSGLMSRTCIYPVNTSARSFSLPLKRLQWRNTVTVMSLLCCQWWKQPKWAAALSRVAWDWKAIMFKLGLKSVTSSRLFLELLLSFVHQFKWQKERGSSARSKRLWGHRWSGLGDISRWYFTFAHPRSWCRARRVWGRRPALPASKAANTQRCCCCQEGNSAHVLDMGGSHTLELEKENK